MASRFPMNPRLNKKPSNICWNWVKRTNTTRIILVMVSTVLTLLLLSNVTFLKTPAGTLPTLLIRLKSLKVVWKVYWIIKLLLWIWLDCLLPMLPCSMNLLLLLKSLILPKVLLVPREINSSSLRIVSPQLLLLLKPELVSWKSKSSLVITRPTILLPMKNIFVVFYSKLLIMKVFSTISLKSSLNSRIKRRLLRLLPQIYSLWLSPRLLVRWVLMSSLVPPKDLVFLWVMVVLLLVS